MPTSNDTRVRVDGFSKISASVLPASGRDDTPAALEVRRDVQHLPQRRGIEVAQIEEVARAGHLRRSTGLRRSRAAAARRSFRRRLGGGRQHAPRRAAQHRHRLVQVGVGDDQRRRQAQHVLAGGDRHQALGDAGGLHLALRQDAFQAEQQARCRARPRTPADTRAAISSSSARSLRPLRSTSSRKPGARITSSTALPAAQASGLPPIGGAVRAGLQRLGELLLRQHGAEREAAADALGRPT